jgi:glycosyltransferase involved in cell wall biosynthesis
MRLCFIDYADWNYNVDAPTIKPFGGSQSALCYLSIELAKLGHDVTIMTGTMQPGMVSGVDCQNISHCNGYTLGKLAYDAVVVLNSSGSCGLRSVLRPSTKLILWTQHETAQPAMRKLLFPEMSNRFDGIVCVSDWQRNTYIETFKLPPEQLTVLRNAIAPCFERLFRDAKDLVNAKSNPLTLAYTSTPYRGLHHLLEIFPAIKSMHPEAVLKVFSSMAVYPKHEEFDTGMFKAGYDALRAMDGVEYIGSLPQPALAERLATSHILAYPNIFPETSCIAVMEAMAAGLRVVTSDFGALPETTDGWADLIHLDFKDQAAYVRNYTHALDLNCRYPSDYYGGDLYEQVVHMNRHHTWSARARQWSEYLDKTLVGSVLPMAAE